MHTAAGDRGDWILSQLVSEIASIPTSDALLRRVAELLSSLDGCREVLAYRWDAQTESLVLAASAPLGRRVVGDDACRLGEGPVGRAALSPGRPVVSAVATRALPRGRAGLAPVDGRGVLMALRVASAADELLGVIGLVFDDRAAATGSILRTLADAGSVAALGLASLRARDTMRQQADLAGCIEILARSVTAETSLDEALAAVASLGLRLTRSRACGVYVVDRSLSDMRLAVVAPRDGAVPPIWRAGPVWAREGEGGPRSMLVQLAMAGAERLGAIVVFDETTRRATADELAIGERLARVVAVAIRQRRLLDAAVERTRAEDLLWEIVGPRGADPAAVLSRAHRLGCSLSEPRVVVAATSSRGESGERLRAAILATDPSAIADVGGNHVVAIVSPDAVERVGFGSWSVGVSQKCHELARYPAAYRQAKETLDLGIRLFGPGRVARFEDLGSYRFVPALIQGGLTSESEYQQLSKLSDDLLRTLEAYLDNGGNTALAAKQLYLHRNTLRQRLERISVSLDIDLGVPGRWLALQLAIKTARMSRL